jgi:hypothetical protein
VPGFPAAATAADDLAAILFTSGSTGMPKGVCYEHGMFEAQVRLVRETYGIVPGEVDLAVLPVFALFDPALGMTTVVPQIDPSRPAAFDPAKLVQAIRARGLRIDGVGSQGHYGLSFPQLDQIDASIADFARVGIKVMFTELDITVLPRPDNYLGAEISKVFAKAPELDPYRAGFPPEKQAELAKRYADIFAIFAKHPSTVTRVTIWGICDNTSWLNNWPIRGRTEYPLLFDRAGQPKPACKAVIEVLRAAPAR